MEDMKPSTFIIRQVHPEFVQNGEITSQVFRPTPKDKGLLSCYNGIEFTPEQSFEHYVGGNGLSSVGVVAVTKEELDQQSLLLEEDNDPFQGHCSVDFRKLTDSEIKLKAKLLKHSAQARGWLYRATIS